MFGEFVAATGVVVVLGFIWGVFGAKDTLHPLVYLMPMVGFFYVYMPISQYRQGGLLDHFTLAELTYVQGFNLACTIAMVIGCYFGSNQVRRQPDRMDVFSYRSAPSDYPALWKIGIYLGAIGLGVYAYQIWNVGGFLTAYSHPKGGGAAGSGYIRDLDMLVVPAIALIYMSRGGRALPMRDKGLIGLFSVPLLVHGILSARRGPTFMALAGLIGGWYLVRRTRPSLPKVVLGGGMVGLLLLILVTFRGEIYIGSSFLLGDTPPTTELVEKSIERNIESDFSTEYMYGTYVVLNSRNRVGHYWGARYLTQLLVRPIPSSIWPDKYEDVGMEVMLYHAGQLKTTNLENHPEIPIGSAPGFIASAYLEWGWAGTLFILGIGWLYASIWRRSLVYGGMWTIVYVILVSVSAYLIAQSFVASLFRILLMSIPVIFMWNIFVSDRSNKNEYAY